MRCGASAAMTTSCTVNPQRTNREQRLGNTVKHDSAFDLIRLQFLPLAMNK